MLPLTQDASPIGFAPTAFAADGGVDEANLFMGDEGHSLEQAVATVDRVVGDLNSQELIEALLTAPIADAVSVEQAAGELDELDALLQESMAPVKAAKEVRAARERLARGGLSKAEREEIERKVREWEAATEWTAVANVALFTEQICSSCDTHTVSFASFMQRQTHRTKAATTRWIAVTELPTRLPNETAVQQHNVSTCVNCAQGRGFVFHAAYRIDAPHEGV